MGSIPELPAGAEDQQALLDAHAELWNSAFGYVKSMALRSALQLGIANTIHNHGGSATLVQIATRALIHPSKIPNLRRLMRVLTVAGIFSHAHGGWHPGDGDDQLYRLTPVSQLLLGSKLAPIISVMVDSLFVSPLQSLGTWLEQELPDTTLFEMAHGKPVWGALGEDPTKNSLFNAAMASDSRFLMDIAVAEYGHVFQGIHSLIDVAGGLGAASQAISKAFPDLECSVLDLENVIAKAPAGGRLRFIAGDMFESIPPANAVLLKWVLHDWGDSECVKILLNCKKAIPPRDAGGKVIIIDMVVDAGPPNLKRRETQVLWDLFMMQFSGIERDEKEWRKIIFEAGFTEYKITPVLGVRSIIEVYP